MIIFEDLTEFRKGFNATYRQCLHCKRIDNLRGHTMRRAAKTSESNNHIHNFEQGARMIVLEKAGKPGAYTADYELNAIIRYEQETNQQVVENRFSIGFDLANLLHELTWKNRSSQV